MLDLILVVLLAAYAVSGYRQGLILSGLSLLGFIAGGAVGLWLVPEALRAGGWFVDSPLARVVLLTAAVFLLASLGQAAMAAAGRRLRPRRPTSVARRVDSLLGAVATLAAAALLIWYVGDVLRGGGPAPLARAVAGSKVMRAIDAVMPREAAGIFAAVREVAAREGFPRVFDGLGPEPIIAVDPPDAAAVTPAVTAVAKRSVVKVTGSAPACARALEGSGWVVARERVVTNAHVVAGVPNPRVQPGGVGPTYDASVVAFDPARDLAVLAVPGLPAAPIPAGTALGGGDPAVVAGYPADGPLRLGAARVRAVVLAAGADIYGGPGVTRQVYSLSAIVRPGNSGGPVLDPSGRVVGIVFARSLDDDSTGYALTWAEAAPVLAGAEASSTAVDTGRCAA
jgi:S1-C subfamily serine protease